jgi:dTMP kinase
MAHLCEILISSNTITKLAAPLVAVFDEWESMPPTAVSFGLTKPDSAARLMSPERSKAQSSRTHPLLSWNMAQRGKFITFEGLDGCGKSTQLQTLAAALRAQNFPVTLAREPGGTAVGEKIRNLLLDTGTLGLVPQAELALMFGARAQHIEEIIDPAIARGNIVLCDRFTDSSEAYQGGGRQLGSKLILELHSILCRNLQPDLTILMDSDVAASIERARRRNNLRNEKAIANEPDENRFERENRPFFERVHNTYLAIAARERDRVVVVNARGTPQETHEQILAVVHRKLKLKTGR